MVLDLVDQQPGWLMEANGVLHPRGSEYQTLFVVDGIPMDENRSPAFAPDLQENAIQAMSVLTGNFPAGVRPEISGVVEVTTNRDIQEGFHGSVDAGTRQFRHGLRRRIGDARLDRPRSDAQRLGGAHRPLPGSAGRRKLHE